MSKIQIKRGDTAFSFRDRLTKDGDPVDLAGASVKLVIKGVSNGVLLRRTAAILTPVAATDPNVDYEPIAADTGVAGEYYLEWEVTFADTKVLTWPQKGYNQLTIQNDLDTL